MAKRQRRPIREVNIEHLGFALGAARRRKGLSLREMTTPVRSSRTSGVRIELQRSGWQLGTMIEQRREWRLKSRNATARENGPTSIGACARSP